MERLDEVEVGEKSINFGSDEQVGQNADQVICSHLGVIAELERVLNNLNCPSDLLQLCLGCLTLLDLHKLPLSCLEGVLHVG